MIQISTTDFVMAGAAVAFVAWLVGIATVHLVDCRIQKWIDR